MSQNQNPNEKQLIQEVESKEESRHEDEESSNGLLDEEQLNDKELVNISGGAIEDLSPLPHQEIPHHRLPDGSTPTEPSPTLPTPPYLGS